MHYNIQVKLPDSNMPLDAKQVSEWLLSGDAQIVKAEKSETLWQKQDRKQFDGGIYAETSSLLLDSEFENAMVERASFIGKVVAVDLGNAEGGFLYGIRRGFRQRL